VKLQLPNEFPFQNTVPPTAAAAAAEEAKSPGAQTAHTFVRHVPSHRHTSSYSAIIRSSAAAMAAGVFWAGGLKAGR